MASYWFSYVIGTLISLLQILGDEFDSGVRCNTIKQWILTSYFRPAFNVNKDQHKTDQRTNETTDSHGSVNLKITMK